MIIFQIFAALIHFYPAYGNVNYCNPNTGPAGRTECVKLGSYNDYQWATCLTDAYIKQKSAGDHLCVDTSRIFCWYQCQIEVHGLTRGDVSNDCKCTVGQNKTALSLPSWCYSPKGDECNWYKNCLESRYPCKYSQSSYAVTYGAQFCNIYNSYGNVSPLGRRWIDSTRKCLQVSLVPLLRSWNNPSCADIKKQAFDSHTCCYKAGSSCAPKGTPSICDLPLLEWWKIFWKIKGSFLSISQIDQLESVYGVWKSANGCFGNTVLGRELRHEWGKQVNIVTRLIEVKLTSVGQNWNRQNAPQATTYFTNADKLAFDVAKSFSRQLGWNNMLLDWFAYGMNSTTTSIVVGILLFDKKSLVYPSHMVLDTTVDRMMDGIKKGYVKLQKTRFQSGFVQLESVGNCLEMSCKRKDKIVKPLKSNGGYRLVGMWELFFLSTAIMYALNNINC